MSVAKRVSEEYGCRLGYRLRSQIILTSYRPNSSKQLGLVQESSENEDFTRIQSCWLVAKTFLEAGHQRWYLKIKNIALAIDHTLKRFLHQILQGYWVDIGTLIYHSRRYVKVYHFRQNFYQIKRGIFLPFYQTPYNPLVFDRSMSILGVEDRSIVFRQFQTPPGPGFISAFVFTVLSWCLERFHLVYLHVHFMGSTLWNILKLDASHWGLDFLWGAEVGYAIRFEDCGKPLGLKITKRREFLSRPPPSHLQMKPENWVLIPGRTKLAQTLWSSTWRTACFCERSCQMMRQIYMVTRWY